MVTFRDLVRDDGGSDDGGGKDYQLWHIGRIRMRQMVAVVVVLLFQGNTGQAGVTNTSEEL